MLSPGSAIPNCRPECPYCGHPVTQWRRGRSVQECWRCLRPMIVMRSPTDWNGPRRLRSLFDLGFAVYGLLTVSLVATFALTGLTPHAFAKWFSVLLFIVGSALVGDGLLGLRTRMDRTCGRLRLGRCALALASAKLLGGTMAILLIGVGLML